MNEKELLDGAIRSWRRGDVRSVRSRMSKGNVTLLGGVVRWYHNYSRRR